MTPVRVLVVQHEDDTGPGYIGERIRARQERADAEQQRRQLAMLTERERIAHDLHDIVIQRIFAAGMRLETLSHLLGDRPDVVGRLGEVVHELDGTISDTNSANSASLPVGAP